MADRLKELRERFALRDERGSMLTVGDFECLLRVAEAAEAYRVHASRWSRPEYEPTDEELRADELLEPVLRAALFAALDELKGGGNG